jgi:Arc/MetJ-type ribon-helix-helix transcriptional regulator
METSPADFFAVRCFITGNLEPTNLATLPSRRCSREGATIDIAKSYITIFSMKTMKTLSVTIPPEMLDKAERLAKKEHRTMSELVREALRQYERNRVWNEIESYGRRSAAKQGIRTEGDVVKLIHDFRRERRKGR